MSRRLPPTLLAVIALALAGCGSDAGDPNGTAIRVDGPTTSASVKEDQTPAAAEEALYHAFAAYQSGDMRGAYATFTKACQKSFGGYLDFVDEARSGLASVEAMTGSKISEMNLRDVRVVEFTPERATFESSVYFDDGSLVTDGADGEADVMVYEDGEWKSDCPNTAEQKFETVGQVIEEGSESNRTTTTVTTTLPKR